MLTQYPGTHKQKKQFINTAVIHRKQIINNKNAKKK